MDQENELIALRRKKIEALRERGIDPFGAAFETSGSIAEVREKFKEGETLRTAGYAAYGGAPQMAATSRDWCG